MTGLLEPAPLTILTGGAGWFGRAYLAGIARPEERHGPIGRSGPVRVLVAVPDDVEAVLDVLPGAQVYVGDVADASVVARLFAEANGASVVHAAGVIHPARVSDFERVNVQGTATVLDAARRSGARRLVHLSSNSPFGANATVADVFRADEPYHPYLGYGWSKMRGEELVRGAHDRGGLETVVVRPPWFYGPWQPARQTMFFRSVRSGRFPLIGDGSQRRSMVYVDNLVQGVALAERVEAAAGGAFWVADGRPYPMTEILSTVKEALAAEGLAVSARQVRLPRAVSRLAEGLDIRLQGKGIYRQEIHVLGELEKTIACDISHTRDILGYRPTVSLREGMSTTVRWCLDAGLRI